MSPVVTTVRQVVFFFKASRHLRVSMPRAYGKIEGCCTVKFGGFVEKLSLGVNTLLFHGGETLVG